MILATLNGHESRIAAAFDITCQLFSLDRFLYKCNVFFCCAYDMRADFSETLEKWEDDTLYLEFTNTGHPTRVPFTDME